MVGKCGILFRIQHFQKGAGGITVVSAGKLVHLIQNHYWVGNSASLDPIHNPSRHGPDIGAAVPSDLRLIPDAPQADPHIFPLQCPGYALADAGLSGSGSAHKQKNGTGLFLIQRHHSNLLDDPLFGLFQSKMIFIQNLSGLGQINGNRFFLFPGKAGNKIQIIIKHAVFMAILPFLPDPV